MNRGKSKWCLLLALIFVISLFLSACSNSGGTGKTGGGNDADSGKGNTQLAAKQELRLAASQDIPTMDIAHMTDVESFAQSYPVFSGLMRFDEKDNQLVPDMASDQPKVSKDKKTYTFKIRKDAKWSNGDPVTAKDFVFSWRREVNPKTAADYAFIFESAGIKNASKIMDKKSPLFGKTEKLGIKALDTYTLQIQLERPIPFFKSLMWFPPFLPLDSKVVKKYGDKFATSPDKMVYNGPYKMTSWKHGSGWTFEKNKDYWNAKAYKLDHVSVKVSKESSTRVNLFNSGAIDEVGLSGEYIDQNKDKEGFHQGLTSAVTYIRLQEKHSKAFKNKNIRDAFYNGIDRKSLANILMHDGTVPARYLVPKGLVKGPEGKDFTPENTKMNAMSLDKAKKLWNRGLKEIGKKSVTLNLIVIDDDIDVKIGQFIKDQYEKNFHGLTININKQPWGQFLKLQQTGDNDMSLSSWLPDYQDPMTFLDLWTSNNPQNMTGYSNPEYDRMVKKVGKLGAQPKKRWKLMQQLEKIATEDAVVVPLDQQGQSWIQKPYLKNINFPVYGPSPDWTHAYIVKH